MNIENIKDIVFDIKAEIDFILLDVQTSQKMGPEELSEFFKWVSELNNMIEDEGVDNDVFVNTFALIYDLTEKLHDHKVEVNESIIKILMTYFRHLTEMVDKMGSGILDEEALVELGITEACVDEIEEILAEVKEEEHAERDAAEVVNEIIHESARREIILFKLNGVKYGVELNKIQEIIVFPEHITRIPGLQDMVLGVINLRGEVTPLIDLRLWFKTQSKDTIQYSEEDIVISVKNETGKIIGLVIDEVEDVIVVDLDDLLPVTQTVDIPNDFLKGLMNYGEDERDMIVVLDVDALLTQDTLVSTVKSK